MNLMSVTNIHLPDGSDVAAQDATCGGCGSSMADHNCEAGGVSGGSVTYSRSGKGSKRTPAASKPPCPHCGAAMHFNMSATAINSECINRQYSLDQGHITDPYQRPPVMTLERMKEAAEWGLSLSKPLEYGGMESSAGGAGTYSAMRPKTGRKKKAAPADPGTQIQDMADAEAEAIAFDGEAPAPTKGKKGKKSKEIAEEIVVPAAVIEDFQADLAADMEKVRNMGNAAPEATSDEHEAPAVATNGAADENEDTEATREARAARRRERKAQARELLAKL